MAISQVLLKTISDYDSQWSIGSRLRAKRVAPLLEIIKSVYADHRCVRIIDIGGRENYWKIVPSAFLQQHNVTITVVNLPGTDMPEDHGCFRFVTASGCDLKEFADQSFHIAHSNSVIEHVGDWESMIAFAQELTRLAPKYFVQTPNYWFPVEPHFMTPCFQWLPKPARIWLVQHFALGHRRRVDSLEDAKRMVDSVNLLTKKQLKSLFRDSQILTERLALLPKSFIAIRA